MQMIKPNKDQNQRLVQKPKMDKNQKLQMVVILPQINQATVLELMWFLQEIILTLSYPALGFHAVIAQDTYYL